MPELRTPSVDGQRLDQRRKWVWRTAMASGLIAIPAILFLPPFASVILMVFCTLGMADWIRFQQEQIRKTTDALIADQLPDLNTNPVVTVEHLLQMLNHAKCLARLKWETKNIIKPDDSKVNAFQIIRQLIDLTKHLPDGTMIRLNIQLSLPSDLRLELMIFRELSDISEQRFIIVIPIINETKPVKPSMMHPEPESVIWMIGQEPDMIDQVQIALSGERINCYSLNDVGDISSLPKPELILLDVDDAGQMQQISELLDMLDIGKHTVKLVLLPPDSFLAAEQLIEAGLNGICLKPLTIENLLSTVKMHLQMGQLQREMDDLFHHRFRQIQNLLDHAENGYLSFGNNLLIHDSHNAACAKIFGRKLSGVSFIKLVTDGNDEESHLLSEIILEMMHHPNASNRAVMRDLLPQSIVNSNLNLELKYHEICDEHGKLQHLMVIVKDVSQEQQLKSQIDLERKSLQLVVKAVTQRSVFIESIEEYRNFCRHDLHELFLSGSHPTDIFQQLYQQIHTFKGTFAQLSFFQIVFRLHDLETRIAHLIKDEVERPERFYHYLISQDLYHWLDQDLKIIYQSLGDFYFIQPKTVSVEPVSLKRLEQRLLDCKLPVQQTRLLTGELKKLYFRPFSEILLPYVDTIPPIANRLAKTIKPIRIEGADVLVDPDYFSEFSRTLVHVFRNAIDHGLETFEERALAYKDPRGEIRCLLDCDQQYVRLMISDDGRGVSSSRVKRKAIELGVITKEEAERMTEDQAIHLIFHPHLSTKQRISEMSGRGIGLSAVHDCVVQLGGNVQVRSQTGKGTTFVFTIPYSHSISLQPLEYSNP